MCKFQIPAYMSSLSLSILSTNPNHASSHKLLPLDKKRIAVYIYIHIYFHCMTLTRASRVGFLFDGHQYIYSHFNWSTLAVVWYAVMWPHSNMQLPLLCIKYI